MSISLHPRHVFQKPEQAVRPLPGVGQSGVAERHQFIRSVIIASRGDVQVIAVRQGEDLLPELQGKAGIKRFHALQAETGQPADPVIQLISEDELVPAPVKWVREYRNAAARPSRFITARPTPSGGITSLYMVSIPS